MGDNGRRMLGIALALVVLAPATPAPAFDASVKTLESRPGVTESFLLVRPEGPPVASVILLSGGNGVVFLNRYGPRWTHGNFLVRSRDLFAGEGLLVAVLDVPSDRGAGYGRFRISKEHAQDVAAVIANLRALAPVPVWLVGTSKGTVSAAFVAGLLQQGGPDGVVLTSSITDRSRETTETILDADLDKIRVPTLIVHHKQDGCAVTRYNSARLLPAELKRSPRKEFVGFEGGVSVGDPCEALAYHGYNGIEREVVHAIATWIKAK
jgi:pimeloyl-ACP methyl ester carboxylesterase